MLPKECRHIKTDGKKCHGMALRGEYYCHFHHPKRRHATRAARPIKPRFFFELPLLEDRGAIEAAKREIYRAVEHREIDLKLAGQMLYALNLGISGKPGMPPMKQSSPRYLKILPVPGFTRLYCTEKNREIFAGPAAIDVLSNAYPQLQSSQ